MEDDGEPAAKRPRAQAPAVASSSAAVHFDYPAGPKASANKKRSDLGDKMIRFEGASERTERKALAAVCEPHGPIAFIDFTYGEASGYVRFKTAEAAQTALFALRSAPPEISGVTPRWRMLSDEEAEVYSEAVKAKRREGDVRKKEGGAAAARSGARGVMLAFDGVLPTTERSTLQAACEPHGAVAFVDFRYGETSGFVRFKTTEAAQAAHAALMAFAPAIAASQPAAAGSAADATPAWRLLDESEEDAYYESVQSKKRQARDAPSAAGSGHATPVPAPSCVLAVDGLSAETDRELVASICAPHGEVAFVDYSRGEPSGYVRFKTAAAAKAAAAALVANNGGEGAPSWRLLNDEEAEEYRQEAQASRAAKGGGKGKGGGRKGKGAKGKGGDKGRGAPRGWGGGRGLGGFSL